MNVRGAQSPDDGVRKVAVFLAGGEEFGIEIGRVVEILRAQQPCRLPHMPSFLSGVVNVRGEVLPLIDLRVRFGLVPQGKKERVLVVRAGGEKTGLVVDGVKEILTLSAGELSEPPAIVKGLQSGYLTGLARKGDRLIVLLNIDTLLTSDEALQIKELKNDRGVLDG